MGVALLLFLLGMYARAELQAQLVKPYLRIETGAHASAVKRIDIDASERFLVSASVDKTARVWDVRTGRLLNILRPPIGDDKEGTLYAVAISPNGASVAVGGVTGPGSGDQPIYIFDRESGAIRKTITGLPNATNHLAYSKDGRYLAAAFNGRNGIRIFESATYSEVARDTEYGNSSYWLEFDESGRLVTTSVDGLARLYGGDFHLLLKAPLPDGRQPFSARFSPDGSLIAVGFADHPTVDVLSAKDLKIKYRLGPPLGGGNLVSTSWSVDGRTLCAAGDNGLATTLVHCWNVRGDGKWNTFPVSGSVVMSIRALHDGTIAFCDAQGDVGLVGPSGAPTWRVAPDLLDYQGPPSSPISPLMRKANPVRLSSQGDNIEVSSYYFNASTWEWTGHLIGFSVSDLTLRIDTESTRPVLPPSTTGLNIVLGKNGEPPTLDGRALALHPFETPETLAVSPDQGSFVLATSWYLRKFDRQGKQIWSTYVPDVAWGVNISADGRFVVAVLGDGTVRWYTFDKGDEMLALFVDSDLKRWVAWSPKGFFTFEGGGDALIGYQINPGPNQEGGFVKVDQLREVFYRRDLIAHILEPGGEQAVLEASNHIGDISKILSGGLPPVIELISPAQATVEGEYLLQFRLKDMGGGLGRVVYRVDGREIQGRGGADIAGTGTDVIKRYIPVANGSSMLTVAARNSSDKIESPQTTIRLTRNLPSAGSNLYVIAAGVTHYKDHSLWEGVRFASGDADDVAARFREQEGKGLYGKVTAVPLPDSRATIKNIHDEVAQAAKTIRPGDTFVLYLAGHGEAEDGEYYFIPWEAEYINQEALLKQSLNREGIQGLLRQIHTNNSVLILDTCGAGAYLEHQRTDEAGAIDKLALMSGNTVLAASDTKEMALEGYENHGVFTYALLEGLEKAQSNANGDIRTDSLGLYLSGEVPRIANKWHLSQSPQINYQGAPFPIARKLPD